MLGRAKERVDVTDLSQGTVIDDTNDEQPLVHVRHRWFARAISDEDPVFRSMELGTFRRFQFLPRCQQSHYYPHGLVGICHR